MDPGERTTGTRDEHYNLIAVLYHALHGAENCEIYAADAEVAGRDELAAFFLEAQAEQIELADRAKELLGIRGVSPEAGATPGAPPTDVLPETPGGIPPETSPRDVPPRIGDVSGTEGAATIESDIPPDTAPGDIPP